MPPKYYSIANKWREYIWVYRVKAVEAIVSGGGYERIDGARLYNWHTFAKIDINGDGTCDWFLTSLAPYSSGGDSDVLNTLYMGASTGWRRVGAEIAESKPDVLGAGASNYQQAQFAFSSDAPLIVWDESNKAPYLIGWFDTRHSTGRQDQEGYHVYRWSKIKNNLEELDKWVPNSTAAQVYTYFKQHGAVNIAQTGISRISEFDPLIEQSEFDNRCGDEGLLKRAIHFAEACKSRKK